MKIKKAHFVKGVVKGKQDWNPQFPHIAFYGRSNAGKSSTINAIVNNKSLAKTSAMPGKTKEINLFLLNDAYYLVDLPGYGFAHVSKSKQDKLGQLIAWYIKDVQVERRVHVIVSDSQVGLTSLDLATLDALYATNEPIIILLNKIDKLKKNDVAQIYNRTKQQVAGHVHLRPFSAKKRDGVDELIKEVAHILS
jgi:GTP-binding protein